MASVRKSSAGFARRAAIGIAAATMVACSGGSDDAPGGSGTAMVTVSGRITFDRVPFKAQLNTGLNFGAPVESPARQVVVEAVDTGSSAIQATTTTDTSGSYSFDVPANRNVFIRAKAQMLKTGASPTWNFRVLNNTNSDALYALDGTPFNTGTGASTRNLRAQTGWGVSNYTGTRAAAPFAILDTMYQVKALVLSAKADTAFPALDLFWSANNRPSDFFCPDSGDIVSSLYTVFSTSSPNDECATSTPGKSGIYVLGSFTVGDTDEFDQHVIAHEAGHYFESVFSRSDSIGGEHRIGQLLDLRLAFGEGWGNAFGAMALNEPVYRDSDLGASRDTGFNLETGSTLNGWYSELSIAEFLWDVFDPVGLGEPADMVGLGYRAIHEVMTGPQRTTPALTSVFSFAAALKAANVTEQGAINDLLAAESIRGSGNDEYGSAETNDAGNPDVLPIYTPIALNGAQVQVCTTPTFGILNKLSNRRFLRLDLLQSALVNVTATTVPDSQARAPDPDIEVFTAGRRVGIGEALGPTESTTLLLPAGSHIVEAYECSHAFSNAFCLGPNSGNPPARGRTCMNIAVSGS